MKVSSENSRSPWMAELSKPAPSLLRDMKCDVVIVGAGITGITTAFLLCRAGKEVVVLDAGPPGGGMTSRTTGHLVTALDGRWFNLIKRRGIKTARIAAESHAAAVDFIDRTQEAETIACDFARLDGFLVLGSGDKKSTLDRELKATASLGLSNVAWANDGPYPGLESGPCLRFSGQGRFHAIKYINGLMASFKREGGHVYCARVESVKGGKKAVVHAGNRKIEAAAVVVATNSPINGKTIHRKQVPYRTYVIAGYAPINTAPDVLGWDTDEPYHYTRLQPAGDGKRNLVIVGGEDHKTGEAIDMDVRLKRLEAWARARFPSVAEYSFHWSGQVMETIDDLALIGHNPGDAENIYIATGDSGIGLTHGTIAALTLSDQILGRTARWSSIYNPARAKPKVIDPHLRKSAKTIKQAVLVEESVAPGSGAVLNRGKQEIAFYRQPDGKGISLSAKCTHAGCTVAWNQFEQCWDCPCHGSHFALDGQVTNAPAIESLMRVARRKG